MGDIWGDIFSTIVQAAPVAFSAYNQKRAADRAKQAKEKAQAEEAAANADAAAAQKAAAEARAKADAAAKEQLMAQQGLTAQGAPLPDQGKILGLDPLVLAAGAVGILGVGAAIFMAVR
jgi:hypothetical protein